MSINYTALSVEDFCEGPDGWQTITGPLNGEYTAPTTDTVGSIVDMFNGWLAANPGTDDAQFNWRLFEFCIMSADKARAATALQAAIDKGKTFDVGVLEDARAKIA